MPERVTKEEKIIELAILKAKEILQDAGHLGRLELDEKVMGEEMKVKKPKKNPSEVKMRDLSNIEGKEDKVNDGTMKKFDALCDEIRKEFAEGSVEQRQSDALSGHKNMLEDLLDELQQKFRQASPDKRTKIERDMRAMIREMKEVKDVDPFDGAKKPMARRF